MPIERKPLILRSDTDCPSRARHIDKRRRQLGLDKARWPIVRGPHLRTTPGERYLFGSGQQEVA